MNNIFTRVRKWFFVFTQAQLFISLISLPVLIAWGLPFSLLTIVGNLIFTPFLSLFLLCSSFIFFLEILHLPNIYLVWLLEYLTHIWVIFLNYGSKTWLIGFPTHTLFIVGLITCIACLTLQHSRWGRAQHSTYVFCVLFIIALCSIKLIRRDTHTTITCRKKTVTALYQAGKLHLQDKGGLGEKVNPTSWIQYTFLPKLIKKFGTLTIKTVSLYKISLPTLDAIATLCRESTVNDIIFTQPQQVSKKSEKYVKNIMEYCKSIKTLRHTL